MLLADDLAHLHQPVRPLIVVPRLTGHMPRQRRFALQRVLDFDSISYVRTRKYGTTWYVPTYVLVPTVKPISNTRQSICAHWMEAHRSVSASFEQHVLCHVLGSLIAWALGLLVYMLFLLWQGYISIIASAFLISQALHRPRAALVDWAEGLRNPNIGPLYKRLFSAVTSPKQIFFKLLRIPSLVQLSLLLALDLLYHVTPLTSIAFAMPCVCFALVAVVYLLDRRLLAFNRCSPAINTCMALSPRLLRDPPHPPSRLVWSARKMHLHPYSHSSHPTPLVRVGGSPTRCWRPPRCCSRSAL